MEVDVDLLLTASVGIATYLLNKRHERSKMKSDATFEMLRTIIFEDGPIYEANLKLAEWCTDDRHFVDDRLGPEDARAAVEILNFFDLIADSADRDIIDKEMVISHLGGRMSNANEVLSDYIKARRKTLNRKGLYDAFERFLIANAEAISMV